MLRRRWVAISVACLIALVLVFASTPLCGSWLDANPWEIIPSDSNDQPRPTPLTKAAPSGANPDHVVILPARDGT